MTPASQGVLKFLTSRLFRNLLLWFFVVLYVMISNINENTQYLAIIFIGKTITLVSLMAFTYANNLWLVPKYLAAGKKGVYFLLVSALVILYSVLFTMHVKLFINTWPIKFHQVVFLSMPFSKSWAMDAFISDTAGYAFTYSLWLLIFTMGWFMNDYSRQQRIAIAAQKKQVEVELDFLKSQINPHFLFNTLNNLYGLALSGSGNTAGSILKLSSILRYLLYESNKPIVSFEREKEIMLAYIDLELLRLSDQDNMSFTIDTDKSCNLPPLLWMPVLENIFKHGTRTISGKHVVDYRFVVEQGKLHIFSRNNIDPGVRDNGEKSGGIGLSNLEKRLSLLYPGRHKTDIQQNDGYYTIQVEIDLDRK